MVDLLVTFIVCQFVTAAEITEILGCRPAGLPPPRNGHAGVQIRFAALRHRPRQPHAFDYKAGFPD
jgi:hypothetical protein